MLTLGLYLIVILFRVFGFFIFLIITVPYLRQLNKIKNK